MRPAVADRRAIRACIAQDNLAAELALDDSHAPAWESVLLLSLQGSPRKRVGMAQLVHGSHRRNKQLFMHS